LKGLGGEGFERALVAPANNADRRQLVTDLAETFFRAAQNNSEFISLDDGFFNRHQPSRARPVFKRSSCF
jgi:hypothetical protein